MRRLLQHPRIIVATLGGMALVLSTILVYVLLHPGAAPAPSQAGPTPTYAASPSYDTSANDAGEGVGPPEVQEALWGPVVDRFAKNFTNTKGGQKEWRNRLIHDPKHPDVTAAVADQLKTVDIRNVPRGHYQSRELVTDGPYEVGVKVTYKEGWAMVIYLITDGREYQIYAYDKWEE